MAVSFDTAVLGEALKVSGQSGFSPFDPRTGGGFANGAARMYDLGLRGTLGRLHYGARMESAGVGFQGLLGSGNARADHAERRVWLGWNFSHTKLRSFVAESWNNVDSDPARPQVMHRQAGLSVDHRFAGWPGLGSTLALVHEARSSKRDPTETPAYAELIDSIHAGLHYRAASWDASLYSGIMHDSGSADASPQPALTVTHYLTATYHPNAAFRITPTLGLYEANYAQHAAHTERRSLGLSLFYALGKHAPRLLLSGSYAQTRSAAMCQDSSNLYLNGALQWALPERGSLRSTLSLEGAFNRYADALTPAASTNSFGFWLVLRLEPPFADAVNASATRLRPGWH